MTSDRVDPYRQFRFAIEIDGIEQMGFTECTFMDASNESISYPEGNESTTISRKISGLSENGNIILKWGITDSMDLYRWRQEVIDKGAAGARKNIVIVLIDETGAHQARWEIRGACPIKYRPPNLNSKANEIAIETLEIAYEEIRRIA
jgi:phage tail-like protein